MPRGAHSLKKTAIIGFIATLVLALDVITKQWVIKGISLYEHIDVLPFLRIVHVENTGAAFGLFSSFGNYVFIIVSICAMLFIALYIRHLPPGVELSALSLVLGGAAGNLLDRVQYGKVIDFVDIYFQHRHWPAFNIADSALTVGIIIFLLVSISRKRHTEA